MRKHTPSAIALCAAMTTGSTATAEGTWILGAAVFGETGVYVGQSDDVSLVPYIAYETERFEISILDGLSYHVIARDGPGDSSTELSFVLAPRYAPDFGDGALFDGLDRDTAIEAGLDGRYETGAFFVDARVVGDVSNTHKGYEASAFAGVQYDVGAFTFESGIGAKYRSSDLNQYLFGVSAADATASRAAFSPGNSTTGFASFSAAYALSDSVAVVGDITFEDLGNATRSPLVDRSSNTSVALGLIYQF